MNALTSKPSTFRKPVTKKVPSKKTEPAKDTVIEATPAPVTQVLSRVQKIQASRRVERDTYEAQLAKRAAGGLDDPQQGPSK